MKTLADRTASRPRTPVLTEMFEDQGKARLRPPLKWAGGKRWQVPHLRPLWAAHRHRRLVEPFCGGLAVTLGLAPQRALLNDINPHVVNFYRWLKRGLTTSLVMTNNERQYYEHREHFNQLLREGDGDSAEAAALFYYLNRTGYNGLCRFNRKGVFNVPFGRYARIRTRETSPPIGNCLLTGTSSKPISKPSRLSPTILFMLIHPMMWSSRNTPKMVSIGTSRSKRPNGLPAIPAQSCFQTRRPNGSSSSMRALGSPEISPGAAHD